MLVIDTLFTPRLLDKGNWSRYIRPINIERAKWMSKENKGLLMLTGHYGNFEITGYLLGQFFYNVYSIATPAGQSLHQRIPLRHPPAQGPEDH